LSFYDFNILKLIFLEFFVEIREENVLKFLMKKKSGQNDAFNPFKSAPKAELANITGRANNTARANNTSPMVYQFGFVYTIFSVSHGTFFRYEFHMIPGTFVNITFSLTFFHIYLFDPQNESAGEQAHPGVRRPHREAGGQGHRDMQQF